MTSENGYTPSSIFDIRKEEILVQKNQTLLGIAFDQAQKDSFNSQIEDNIQEMKRLFNKLNKSKGKATQWGFNYWTSSDFEWPKASRMLNVLISSRNMITAPDFKL